MGSKRVAFAGMDGADEAGIRDLFEQANSALGEPFLAGGFDEADVLFVDVDSIHGHMTWLRVHSAPELSVVAISNRQTQHAAHCLVRPVDAQAMHAVLSELAAGAQPAEPADTHTAQHPEDPADDHGAEPALPLDGRADSSGTDGDTIAVDAVAGQSSIGDARDEAAPSPEALDEQEPAQLPEAPRSMRLGDYLKPGALPGPARLTLAGAPALVVDPAADAYLGPAQLKPLQAYADLEHIEREQWDALEPAELADLANGSASLQPLARLVWLSGLRAAPGQPAPGRGPDEAVALTRWPQIEREFPRHFRIATVMMKGPATPDAIAEASGTPVSEVHDFINASLAAGHAGIVREPEQPEPVQPRPGLLGRIKGLRG